MHFSIDLVQNWKAGVLHVFHVLVIFKQLSLVVFKKHIFCDTTIGEQCKLHICGERWQSPGLGLLECEGNPVKHVY